MIILTENKKKMKKFYRFMFYKLFRFSKLEEQTVDLKIGFLVNVIVFQLLHLAIFFVFLKLLGFDFFRGKEFLITSSFIVFVSVLNYYYFIKKDRIFKVNQYYQKQKRNILKDNLVFFTYIILLFLIIFIETWIFKIKFIG